MRPRVTAALFVLAIAAVLVAAGAHGVDAQTRRPGAATPRSRGVPLLARGRAAFGTAGDAGVAPGTLAAPQPASPPAGGAATGSTDAGIVESRTLDGGTHVFKFSELDIEGRLKSPQLVYFLRRVRAEFAAGELGHRSFMHEMSETRKEPTF